MPTSLRALVAPALLAAACGGATPGAVDDGNRPRHVPPAVRALFAALPPSAPSCVVVRSAGVDAAERDLVALLSGASPLAWAVPAELWIEARRPDLVAGLGAGDLRGVARLPAGLTLDAARARITERAPEVAWGGAACDAAWCLRVAPLPPDGLRLSRGDRPAARRPEGDAMASCRRLAADHPRALEVSVVVGPDPGRTPGGAPGRRVETRVERAPDGVIVTRVLRGAHPPGAATSRLEAFPGTALVDPARMAPLPHAIERRVRGADVLERARFLWADLRLGLEDRRRLLEALREGGAAPDDVADADLTLARVRHLERRLERLSGDGRRRTVAHLVALLERAVAAHPEEPAFAWALARVRLEAQDDPAAARAIAERVLDAGIDGEARWRRLRREAAGREGEAALAAALADDGRVPRRDAPAAARAIVASLEAGLSYAEAERAERLDRSLGASAGAMARTGRAVGAAVRDLAVLARWIVAAALPEGHPLARGAAEGALVLRARGAAVAPEWTGVVRREDVRALTVAGDGGPTRLAWSRGLDDAALRATGDALVQGLRAGAVWLDVGLELGEALVPVLRAGGAVEPIGDLTIRRVDRRAAGLDWARLDDDLLAGLASLERLFPAPELVVREPADARRAALLAWARDRTSLDCAALGGDRLRCRASTLARDAGSLSAFAVEVLRGRLPAGWSRRLRRDVEG